jgi:hypothetical protein
VRELLSNFISLWKDVFPQNCEPTTEDISKMYGLVNRAIQDHVTEEFGQKIWEIIKIEAGVDVEYFMSSEVYDDKVTYDLAIAASKILNMGLDTLLHTLGKYWSTRTAVESYGSLMKSTGSNLAEFLVNLPNLHSHVKMIYPQLKPPTFKVLDVSENGLTLHYYTSRPGLQKFLEGVVIGLGEVYETPCRIEFVLGKNDVNDPDVFRVSW